MPGLTCIFQAKEKDKSHFINVNLITCYIIENLDILVHILIVKRGNKILIKTIGCEKINFKKNTV